MRVLAVEAVLERGPKQRQGGKQQERSSLGMTSLDEHERREKERDGQAERQDSVRGVLE